MINRKICAGYINGYCQLVYSECPYSSCYDCPGFERYLKQEKNERLQERNESGLNKILEKR